AIPSPVVAVPASLHASLMARLDRLRPPQEGAQIGAVIGRDFSHALLAAVVTRSEAELSIGAGQSHGGRFVVSPGCAATSDLPIQACACTGRLLRHAAARDETAPTGPYTRNS